jgi:hypothetical protein
MSILDRFFDYAREVVALTKDVQDLGRQVEQMQERQLEIDRRLVRVETTIELAREQARHRRMPPGS